jgi:hypothetical protein
MADEQTVHQQPWGQPSSGRGYLLVALVFGLTFALTTGTLVKYFDTQRNIGGMASTATVDVEIASEFGIEVDSGHAAIAFGTLTRDDVTDTFPPSVVLPFLIRNIGNEVADVEVCADSSLWSGASAVASDYQFSVAAIDSRITMDSCSTLSCFDEGSSAMSLTDLPITCPVGTLAVNDLQWEDTNDEAVVHISVHVPADEPPGAKTSIVTFSAVSSSTH